MNTKRIAHIPKSLQPPPKVCRRSEFAKQLFDRVAALIGLITLSPAFLAVAVCILLEDGFPVLFRQIRIGRFGRRFVLYKFRSMRTATAGAAVTARGDPRITSVGKWIRRYKADELPQLWNVLKGDMSLVGPRPEVPAFVDLRRREWRTVLQTRPGLTDLASLTFRNEEDMLAGSADPDQRYKQNILPAKLAMSIEFQQKSDMRSDLKIIWYTICFSWFPRTPDPKRMRRMFLKSGPE